MKRWCCLLLVVGVCLAQPFAALAATETPAPSRVPSAMANPGLEIAQTLSMITGVAISPLLGVGAVGAWQYFKAPPAQRARLAWFAQPAFWLPALLLVAAVFAKDALGPAVPIALKKPFDVAEVFENKLSALVATGAFIPLIISVFPTGGGGGDSAAALSPVFALIDLGQLGNYLLVPFAAAIFAIVWLAAHAINMLILISPFATVDAALKAFRLTLLATVTGTSFAHPYFGAAWSLILILVCTLIAGWSFRLTCLGTLFAWDLVTFRRKRCRPQPAGNAAFLARASDPVPVRTYGRLSRNAEGQLRFVYRPWLVLPSRELILPAHDCVVGQGLLHPELRRHTGADETVLFRFPPRFRTHERALAEIYAQGRVEAVGWVAAWRWLKELLGAAPSPSSSPAPASS